MVLEQAFHETPQDWLRHETPDEPVYFFAPAVLQQTAARFQKGFAGLVSYAVKANPDLAVLETLAGEGITVFDVASPEEMLLARQALPTASLHYHNPVRSVAEIATARRMGVLSWSVDRLSELDKLGDITGQEIAVRLKLPVRGAAYDFGAKFGAGPEDAAALLRVVAERGGIASMTFHPGTQCADPEAWARYIAVSAQVAAAAQVTLHRLNVGGGFAAQRGAKAPDLEAIFARIAQAAREGFGTLPQLVCEPGRALVAEAFQLVLRLKSADRGAVFLNDGIYGALAEWRDIGPGGRIAVLAPDGTPREGPLAPRVVFGPTCDSLDRLPEPLPLPDSLKEGDYLLLGGMGAYAQTISTRFNGYGAKRIVTLKPPARTGHETHGS